MKRRATEALNKWCNGPNRIPLLIRGARQVGKTWLVRELAKSFDSFVEINFESDIEYHKPFQEYFGKTKELIPIISLLSGKKIIPGATLLFLDEIQACKEALLSLRYFKEQLPDLHVIAAGSLLEFAIRELSFPVGRIDFFHLFPLNFEEYLQALQRGDLIEAIQSADENKPFPEAVHQLLLDEVAVYCLIGGMPEAVRVFVETKDFSEVQKIQQRVVATYREDFYKYATRTKVEYLRKLYEGIPRLLGQKFKYSQIDREIKSRDLGVALNLLTDAGLVYKVHHSSARGIPLSAQTKESKFKVFCLDIGFAQRILGLDISQLLLEKKTLLVNRGQIAEQFVAQELISYTRWNETPRLHYWHREEKTAMAEVDFVIEHQSSILPIEVKSRESVKAKSLHIFMQERGQFIKQGIIVSGKNFGRRETVLTFPFYAILKLFSIPPSAP